MARRSCLVIIVILISLVAGLFPIQIVKGADSGWIAVDTGIDYQEFILPGPNHAFVARMDRYNESVTLESVIANGRLAGGRETVSSMAARSDETLNNWDGSWGSRSHVIVAINGSYFNPTTGWPENGLVQSGWYAKRYDNLEGWSGFAWSMDRNATIGRCVANPPGRQTIIYLDSGDTQVIDDVNASRENDQLILFTPQFGATTRMDNSGVEVVVEMKRPTLIMPAPAQYVTGVITDIQDHAGSSIIPFDGVVLSAIGAAREKLLQYARVGEAIQINQEITSYDDDCETSVSSIRWEKTYSAIGGAYNYLRDSEIRHNTETGGIARNPRTAIAYNADYIFFIVVDGRAPGVSVGMTLDELGGFTRDILGATDAVAQDGGGSSTMVIGNRVMNHPSDGCTTNGVMKNRVYLPMVGQDTTPQLSPTLPESAFSAPLPPSGTVCERPVANGMMMVVVEPMVQSTSYVAGSPVIISRSTIMRSGPGENYPSLGVIPLGMMGNILSHSNGLDGVLATGSYWWKVQVDGMTGWVSEAALAPAYYSPLNWRMNLGH